MSSTDPATAAASKYGPGYWYRRWHEAATEVDSLRAEVDRLKALARRLHDVNGETIADFVGLLERVPRRPMPGPGRTQR